MCPENQSDHGSVASRMFHLQRKLRLTGPKPTATPCPHLPAHTRPLGTFLEAAPPPPAKPRARAAPRRPPRPHPGRGVWRAELFPFRTTAPAGSRQRQGGQASLGAGVRALPEHSSFSEDKIWIPEQAALWCVVFLERSCPRDIREKEYVTEDTEEKKKKIRFGH